VESPVSSHDCLELASLALGKPIAELATLAKAAKCKVSVTSEIPAVFEAINYVSSILITVSPDGIVTQAEAGMHAFESEPIDVYMDRRHNT
jgi:hypothetical protein